MTKQKPQTKNRRPPLHRAILGTFFKQSVGDKVVYIPRYGDVYQPEGHLFHPNFKVLLRAYFRKYKILTWMDCNIYSLIQDLCESGTPFCIEDEAALIGISQNTFRKCCDNLVNAELLEIFTIGDGQGQPNSYILRTPLFERATFDDAAQKRFVEEHAKRIAKTGGTMPPLPTVFLEDEADRLKKQIKDNGRGLLRKLKNLKTKNSLTETQQTEYETLAENFSQRQLAIHSLFKKLRVKTKKDENGIQLYSYRAAVEFDRLVWDITRSMPNAYGEKYWEIFVKILKARIVSIGVVWTNFLDNAARELSVFYDVHQRRMIPQTAGGAAEVLMPDYAAPEPKLTDEQITAELRRPEQIAEPEAAPPPAAPDETGGESDETAVIRANESVLRRLLSEKADGVKHWNGSQIADVVKICKDFREYLPDENIALVAFQILPLFISKKLTVEKLE